MLTLWLLCGASWHGAPATRVLPRVGCARAGAPSRANVLQPEPPFDLILSSGFLCFSSHAGFVAALEDRAMQPDAIVGTSSGALAAALLAAGYSSDDIADLLSMQRPIALARPALPWRGLASTRALEALMRELLPPTFEELDTPLALGVFRTCRGERSPLLLVEGDLPAAVAASCAVPRIFAPVNVGVDPRGPYADGGAIDRTGVAAWRRWRPGKSALLHLVSDLVAPQVGPRDGFSEQDASGGSSSALLVVRTARAKASFVSLGDFEGERDAARRWSLAQLDAR